MLLTASIKAATAASSMSPRSPWRQELTMRSHSLRPPPVRSLNTSA
jgi:hypothetical protein